MILNKNNTKQLGIQIKIFNIEDHQIGLLEQCDTTMGLCRTAVLAYDLVMEEAIGVLPGTIEREYQECQIICKDDGTATIWKQKMAEENALRVVVKTEAEVLAERQAKLDACTHYAEQPKSRFTDERITIGETPHWRNMRRVQEDQKRFAHGAIESSPIE